MSLLIVTVVKNDLLGLKRTEASIRRQSQDVKWTIVSPPDHSDTFHYALGLKEEGLVAKVLPDSGNGIYSAMNLAISESEEEDWLWFLNAGDELARNDSLALVENHILEARAKWIYGGHKLGSDSGLVLGEVKSPIAFRVENQLFAKKYISHQATIFKNQFLQELGGFRENLRIAADWDLMVRASKIDKGHRIEETISIFYMGGESTLQRRVGNRELLLLRREHLAARFSIMSYLWFVYREFRNYLVQCLETRSPEQANRIRILRIKFYSFFSAKG